jgi:hypothetical protein
MTRTQQVISQHTDSRSGKQIMNGQTFLATVYSFPVSTAQLYADEKTATASSNRSTSRTTTEDIVHLSISGK